MHLESRARDTGPDSAPGLAPRAPWSDPGSARAESALGASAAGREVAGEKPAERLCTELSRRGYGLFRITASKILVPFSKLRSGL